MALISCKNVSKTYQIGFAKRKVKKVLRNLSFQVEHNEVFGIVGANGAGKSTLLKILMGFVKPDSGHIFIGGEPADSNTTHKYIGYLPETACLYRNLSISQHLRFSTNIAGCPRSLAQEKIEAILHTVDLTDAATIPIRRLSKGMAQRAALAYALLLEPEILILDEPMSGLDPLGRRLVLDIITEYHGKKKTILFCSHILADVERISSRIGLMHQGQLAAVITPDELAGYQAQSNLPPGAPPLESFFLKTIQKDTDATDDQGDLIS